MRSSTTILELLATSPTDFTPPTGPTPPRDPGRDRRRVSATTPGQLWSWRQRARCRGSDSGVFFAPYNERGPARHQREQAAKAICARCPVRQPCATYALNSRETHGVWGGLSETERAAILRMSGVSA